MDLRSRWRNSTRIQDAGTAAGTFVAGLACNLVGLTDIWTLPEIDGLAGATRWWHP